VPANRVLRRVFGIKREEVAGGWRRLHNEVLLNLYTSPNTNTVIKSRRMRKGGHVARMRGHIKIRSENLNGRDHSDDLGIDVRIILG
jgi:hypothetical protein